MHVARDSSPREQAWVLKDKRAAQVTLLRRLIGNEQFAGARLAEPGNESQEGRLAAARRTDDRHKRAGLNFNFDVADRRRLAAVIHRELTGDDHETVPIRNVNYFASGLVFSSAGLASAAAGLSSDFFSSTFSAAGFSAALSAGFASDFFSSAFSADFSSS